MAELCYQPTGWERPYRYVVKRELAETKSGDLYWQYHALVTNDDAQPAVAVLSWHWQQVYHTPANPDAASRHIQIHHKAIRRLFCLPSRRGIRNVDLPIGARLDSFFLRCFQSVLLRPCPQWMLALDWATSRGIPAGQYHRSSACEDVAAYPFSFGCQDNNR